MNNKPFDARKKQEARALSEHGRPFWSCILIGAKTCAAAGMAEDAISLLRELAPDNAPVGGEDSSNVGANEVADMISGVSANDAEDRQENNTSSSVFAADVAVNSGDAMSKEFIFRLR